jgi:hypothetical protein
LEEGYVRYRNSGRKSKKKSLKKRHGGKKQYAKKGQLQNEFETAARKTYVRGKRTRNNDVSKRETKRK